MKPTLTQRGGLSNQEGFTLVHQQVELIRAMRLRSIRTNRFAVRYGLTDLLRANAKDLIQYGTI